MTEQVNFADKYVQLKAGASNLYSDFMFIVNCVRTPEDVAVVEKALNKAFACIPSASDLPTVSAEEKTNQAAAMKHMDNFLSKLEDANNG